MRKVKIITDSCSDMTAKQLEEYGVDYVKMSTVEDGVESPALLGWSPEEAHVLYEKMRDGKRITTAQVSVEEFHRVFKQYLEDGFDIVYIACSSKQSGSVNTGYVVAKKLLENYPEATIECIDSHNATIGIGMLVMEGAKMAEAGMSSKEIADKILELRHRVHQFATVQSLDTLKRSGRISASSAFFGNLMGVKPVFVADANGVQAAYKKVKGRQTAIRECVSLLKEHLENSDEQTIYLWHSDCDAAEVEMTKAILLEEIPCRQVEIGIIGPIIGASVGPSLIALFGFGKERTFVSQA